jgi:uncharacterized protein (UPF0276 family)
MRNLPGLSQLGVGIVWWPGLDPLCRPEAGLVQVIETEPEVFWTPTPASNPGFVSGLPDAIRHLPQPKLLHGVGAPFGGRAAQSAAHRQTLAGDIDALQPAWISDHLSFDRFWPVTVGSDTQPVFTGFFMPPAQSARGVAQAAAHIGRRQAATGVPVAFENPVSYLAPAPGEMPDGDFVAAVAVAADCGILLDLHNVLCNARNGRQSVRAFCDAIPLDRVWEIHLAGGAPQRGFWLDAHSGLVEPELMDILSDVLPRLPSLCAITFEIIPEYVASIGLPAIARMLGKLNDIWRTYTGASARRAAPPSQHVPAMPDAIDPSLWEHALGAAVNGMPAPPLPPDLAAWIGQGDAPLALYTVLAQEGRAASLVMSAPRTIRLLLRTLGEADTRALLAQFWNQAAPAYTTADEGRAFLDFLSFTSVPVPGLHAEMSADLRSLLRPSA